VDKEIVSINIAEIFKILYDIDYSNCGLLGCETVAVWGA
jgi:hypothetical protein